MQDQIETEVVYSARATKPRIDMDIHGMKVVIPDGMNLTPEQLIEEKREWIERKKKEMDELRSRIPDRRFEPGSEWPYRGTGHLLEINAAEPSRIKNDRIVLERSEVEKNGVKEELENLYREKARGFIEEVLDEYTDKLGVDFNTFRVKNQKTLWGSCSSKNNLNFNWRIIMAPPEVAEYVVLHELCHLREPNHSDRFWTLLSRFCENPRKKARWLKENAVKLIFTEDDL